MAVKLIAIYQKPDDETAFLDHYRSVHTPLVEKVPGLVSMTVNRVLKHLYGGDRPYMIVEMIYADRASFDTAMASDENKATGKDVMAFAKDIVSLMVAEAD
jgi:uncharacterized protein (TIGR02118 family)